MNDRKRSVGVNTFRILLIIIVSGWVASGCTSRLFTAMKTTADQSPASMKLALVHFAAAHKKPQQNLAQLVSLNRQAAEAGASLILNTEMAVSGYSFKSRQDIAPYTETDQGPAVRAMKEVASDYKVYIGIAFAERDPATDIYYNAAVLLGPDGRVLVKYRKVLAERRWARSGSPVQQGVADTPWGRVGIAICADSYSGLIARTMALKAVDLLWVPANWPVAGGLDPMTVWRARVLENGFYLAACNRTGKDLTMDCTQAVSCVLDPMGRAMFAGAHATSRVFLSDIPLDANGRWADVQRASKMQKRELGYYRPVYLQPWMEDFTGFYHLPEPGCLHIHCIVPKEEGLTPETLTSQIETHTQKRPALWVLPMITDSAVDEAQLAAIAKRNHIAIATVFPSSTGAPRRVLITADGTQTFMSDVAEVKATSNTFPFRILHVGPAAVAMAPVDAFAHPELAVTLSKLGSDLVIVSDAAISDDGFLLSRIKALAGVAVVASSNRGVQITGVHDHHFNWEHEKLDHSGVLSYVLDTAKTRKKMFHENIDYDLLLTTP